MFTKKKEICAERVCGIHFTADASLDALFLAVFLKKEEKKKQYGAFWFKSLNECVS